METTLGWAAHGLIQEQYEQLLRQEESVLLDEDPEALHKMRVACRRLRTALQVFAQTLDLPTDLTQERVRDLGRALGGLRDLDVQRTDLMTYYQPRLPDESQVTALTERLTKQRRRAYSRVQHELTRPRYQKLKRACADWLAQPRYHPVAKRPLSPLLPYLLGPLCAEMMLHPGWLLDDDTDPHVLHDLRKALKHVRYEAEFFADAYPPAFKDWIKGIKTLQETLGTIQDTGVLAAQLSTAESDLHLAIQDRRARALLHWRTLRRAYLEPVFLTQLAQIVARPAM
ncbi:CHAD domain-containing protein [Candidatus Cyanaurora vandensis]|uniref:CHAD domain-containing protein n=1 Tax=Candidatus Cyanaurora vandensis TaxID=2714958 RepID=UPI00257BB897|nr:CHAD domain-containing protein [Candidatus Cyanaurora vandensis]